MLYEMTIPKWFGLILSFSILFFAEVIVLFFPQRKVIETFADISCSASNLSGEIDFLDSYAFFDSDLISIPEVALIQEEFAVLGATHGERWVEVDLSEQKLRAWDGSTLYLETPVSTGLPWWPTPTGEFRIWIKLRATKMEGGSGKYYYYLPNVPYVMYFENESTPGYRGFGLHGTYWHNDFGTPRSHGCVNLPTEVAKELYFWVDPMLSDGKSTVWASENNQGTRIVIHE